MKRKQHATYSWDKEKSDEHMVSLEKLSTLETVCLLSKGAGEEQQR